MNYLVQKAQALGQPIAINMSLGGHFGAHDGTSAQERVIDDLSGPGVVFCVAAGNEGENYLAESGPASGHDFTLRLLTYEPTPGTNNDGFVVILWYEGNASTAVRVSTAGFASTWVLPGETGSGSTSAGFLVIDNASQGADPVNGDKLCLIQVDDRAGIDVAAGDWTIAVDDGTGNAHAWLIQSSMTAGFPNSDQSYSLGMPASAESAVSVAAWKTRNTWPGTGGTFGYTGRLGGRGDRRPRALLLPGPHARRPPEAGHRRRQAWRSSPAIRRIRIRPPRPRCACPATTTG